MGHSSVVCACVVLCVEWARYLTIRISGSIKMKPNRLNPQFEVNNIQCEVNNVQCEVNNVQCFKRDKLVAK
jgi:hypothetical protein